MSSFTPFVAGYVSCALWTMLDEDGSPLDFGYEDIAADTLAVMIRDCEQFQEMCRPEDLALRSDADNGHDFWLTRNGHGAGFWDRGLGEAGERLSAIARDMGERDLYLGDDGLIYQD